MQRIEGGIVYNTEFVAKVRMVYAGKQWHVQYKKKAGWFWKPYCSTPNYELAKKSLDSLYKSCTVTIHRYSTNETLTLMGNDDNE